MFVTTHFDHYCLARTALGYLGILLCFVEARSFFATLRIASFNEIDTDNDGFLSAVELSAQAGAGEGEGPMCTLTKSGSAADFQKLVGDVFLLGLAMVVLGASGSLTRRRDE